MDTQNLSDLVQRVQSFVRNITDVLTLAEWSLTAEHTLHERHVLNEQLEQEGLLLQDMVAAMRDEMGRLQRDTAAAEAQLQLLRTQEEAQRTQMRADLARVQDDCAAESHRRTQESAYAQQAHEATMTALHKEEAELQQQIARAREAFRTLIQPVLRTPADA